MGMDAEGSAGAVTKADWYWGPGNRWAWRNMRRLFPTACVGRGTGDRSPLATAPLELGEVAFMDPAAGERSTIAQMLVSTYADAFIVLKDGAIVYERYFNGMQAHDTHLLMSVTKSVVGALAGVLIGQGRIDPEASLEAFLPKLADTSFAGATLQQLMNMQVARPLATSLDPIDAAAGWLPATGGPAGLQDYLLEPGRPIGPHGERFVYLTENTTLASWVLEQATGKDFAALLEEEIWSKLGAEFDADLLLDAYQTPFTSAGLNMTLRDLARFAQMMLQGGRWNGSQIVPEAWIAGLRKEGDPSAWTGALKPGDAPPFQTALQATPEYAGGHYRSFWWASSPAIGRYAGLGLGGQSMIIDPSANVVAVTFSSTPDPISGAQSLITNIHAVDALTRALA